MKRLQAFKYQLRPDGEQAHRMRRFAGACRFVFNKALALQKERCEGGEKKFGYAGLCKQLTACRSEPETAWLSDAPIHPLQQTLKDLERAYGNFFAKRAPFPRFRKKRKSAASFRYPDPKQIRLDQGNDRVFLPKLGWLRYRNSREVLGEVKNLTVRERGGKWFISMQTAREVAESVHSSVQSWVSMSALPGSPRFRMAPSIRSKTAAASTSGACAICSGAWRVSSKAQTTEERRKPRFRNCTAKS